MINGKATQFGVTQFKGWLLSQNGTWHLQASDGLAACQSYNLDRPIRFSGNGRVPPRREVPTNKYERVCKKCLSHLPHAH